MQRSVVVVGGSSGVGHEIASTAWRNGARVVTAQRRKPAVRLDGWVPLDLRGDRSAIETAAGGILRACSGRIDWLVLSGGVGAYTGPRAREGQLEELWQTNYRGPVSLFEALTRGLHRDEHATSRVLYIGSTAAHKPARGLEHYAASKAAAETYFRHAARKFARWGIRINVLSLGWVQSPMTAEIKPEIRDRILRSIPLGRMADVDEAATVALSILGGPEFWNGDRIEFSGGQ